MNTDTERLKNRIAIHTQLQGQQEAGTSNLIVVVLSFNAFPRYVQIEVDSLPAVSGW